MFFSLFSLALLAVPQGGAAPIENILPSASSLSNNSWLAGRHKSNTTQGKFCLCLLLAESTGRVLRPFLNNFAEYPADPAQSSRFKRPWIGLWPSLPGLAGTSGPGTSSKVTLEVSFGLRCENDDALVTSTSPMRQVLEDELAAFSIAWLFGLRNLLAMCKEVSFSIAWPLGLRNLLAINADSSFSCSLLPVGVPASKDAAAFSLLAPASELAAFSIAWPLGLRNLLAMCEEVSFSNAWPLSLRNLLAINADSSFSRSLLLSTFPVRASVQAVLELLITDPSMLHQQTSYL